MKFLKEDINNKYIDLYYDSLPITRYSGWTDDNYYELPYYKYETEDEVGWEYKADRDQVKELIATLLPKELIDNMDDDELDNYIEDDIYGLVEKYDKQILDYFEDNAIEEAQLYYMED